MTPLAPFLGDVKVKISKKLMAPIMVTNGDSGNIGANGNNDDPLETMLI